MSFSEMLTISVPRFLDTNMAGCAPLRRPPSYELAGIALLAFSLSALSATLLTLMKNQNRICARLNALPVFLRWRALVTVAALHQPIGMLFLMPPQDVLSILLAEGNPWLMTTPRQLWLALFYLFGAWGFEVMCLLHPATGARKAYGFRGYWIQIVHHVGFPALAIHNVFSGCAVPGVAVACCTEFTLLFTSTYWLLKTAGVADESLKPLRKAMQVSTYLFRGLLVVVLDYRALTHDQREVPMADWCIQVVALVLINALNIMIIRLIIKATTKQKTKGRVGGNNAAAATLDSGSLAGHPCPIAVEVNPEKVRDLMKRIAKEASGVDVEADTPLMESGIDSRAAVDFYNRLSTELGSVHFPTTLVFDYPTLNSIAHYTVSQIDPVGYLADQTQTQATLAGAWNEPLALIGTACLFPGGSTSMPKFRQQLLIGGDGQMEIPFTRWEINEYFDPNPDAPGKAYPRHGAFVEGADQFDAAFFEITAPEARAMDPQQRLVLEVAHDGLIDGGSEKRRLLGTEVAVLVGMSNNDWIQVQSGDIRKLNPYTAIGTSASIGAARIAYTLGLKGPAYVIDTACSSALVALDSSAMNLRRARCTMAVTASSNVMASAATYISFSKPRMLSPQGRCFTFDASADGYARGEGAGAAVLRRLADASELARAELHGVAVNQDGRSATMTAPNGPSQQSVVNTALQEAGMVAAEVQHMECHGTGTPLGDPIEVGALRAVNAGRSNDANSLLMAAVKTNIGHLEGAAAAPGLLKTVLLLQRGVRPATLHLRSLNPHIGALAGFAKAFPPETVSGHSGMAKGRGNQKMIHTGALSSFGFGGTNAHTILASSKTASSSKAFVAPPKYKKKSFAWREVGYRFLREQPQEGSFDVAMTGDAYDIASHHVVFGSIVVPGVIFTEMALEATRRLFGQSARLTDVAMVFPFVVPFRKSAADPGPTMRFVLKGEKRFQIQSVGLSGKVQTHVEGGIDLQAKEGDASRSAKVDLSALREHVDEVIEPAAVYHAINHVGLALGPMFQVAKEVWRKMHDDGTSEILALLKLDPKVPNIGYVVHPALFDGTIHTLAAASLGRTDAGLMIFGGAGRVTVVQHENFSQLDRYWVHIHVFETTDTSQTFNVKVMTNDGVVLMLLDDVVFRSVRPEQIQLAIAAQGTPEDDQKMYEIDWVDLSDEASPESEARIDDSGFLLLAGDVHSNFTEELHSELGSSHSVMLLSAINEVEDFSKFPRIVNLAGLSGGSTLDVLDGTLVLMKRLINFKGKLPELWIVTRSTQAAIPGDMEQAGIPVHAGLWGLARTLRNERPDLMTFLLDLDEHVRSPTALLQHLISSSPQMINSLELDTSSRHDVESDGIRRLLVPRLVDATSSIKAAESFELSGTYVISGGLGALGLIFARWALDKGSSDVVLMSRSGKPPADCKTLFKKLASTVAVKTCDVTSLSDVQDLMKGISEQFPPVRGIIHAAGSLRDSMIAEMDRSHLEAVVGAKVDGTLNLHKATLGLSLDFFAAFSTFAAVIGSVGQANYNAANSFMDSFASYRRGQNLPAVSIQWGPWAEVGMAARANTSESAISRIQAPRGLEAMEAILGRQGSLRNGVVGVACVKWKSLLAQAPRVPPFLANFSGALASRKANAAGGGLTQDAIKSLVIDTLQDVMDVEGLDLSTPLMEMGLDSLAGVEFRNRLQASFEGLELSSTLMFDYPTVPDLVEYIFSEVGTGGEDEVAGVAFVLGDVGEQLAIASHSERVPGSLTNDLREYWQTLLCGLDTTSELPPERWDINAFFDENADVSGTTYVKLGHFIPGIEKFDGQFFGIGEAEQRGMDPHQWLTVEITYDAFYAAGYDKETLSGLDCGVYVGCATLGGLDVEMDAIGPYTNIGYAYSGLSGRVSHCFSLRGPCFTIDTACSSTVVALDCGCQAVRLGRAACAVASGVNIQLSAAIWVGFSKMGGLARDGRCKTFDVRGDGFARGEGLGSVFVQRASACKETSPPVALLSGVATNHDGRAATITAPNGTAQQRVLRAALAERGTAIEDVSVLECHGTGTALGDPIELGAVRAVYGKGRSAGNRLALTAVKTNLGHLEGSAGVAGVSKCVMMLQHKLLPPNLWLEHINPNIELGGYASAMPSELLDFRAPTQRASVSSFGFSGTNGHAVIEGIPEAPAVEVKQQTEVKYARRLLKPVKEWLQKILYVEEWVPAKYGPAKALTSPCIVIGDGPVSTSVRKTLSGASRTSPKSSDEYQEALTASAAEHVVFAAHGDAETEEVPGETLQKLMTLLQALQKTPKASLLVVVTRGAWDANRTRFDSGAALWGLVRSARLEMPRLTVKLIDVPLDANAKAISEIVAKELASPSVDLEVSHCATGRCVPRLKKSPDVALKLQRCDAMADEQVLGDGVQLVTGGLGSLGLITAQQLAELGARSLVLTSRSGRVASGLGLEGKLDRLQAFPGTSVKLRRCDVSKSEDVSNLVAEIVSPEAPLRGVVHAAGVLERCALAELNLEKLSKVMSPKANGAWNLHTNTEAKDLGLFVLFSSISATVGLVNGAAYSAASAYLDALARWRWQRHGGLSIRFGPVAEGGMTDVEALPASSPLQLLHPTQAASALRYLLAKHGPSAPPGGEVMLVRADWGSFTRELGVTIPQLTDFKPDSEATAEEGGATSLLSRLPFEERLASVLATVRSEATSMGLDIEEDSPLMEAGIDSLSAVEFRSKVSREFKEVRLPSTLMFDYPTLKALSGHIAGQIVPSGDISLSQAPTRVELGLSDVSRPIDSESTDGRLVLLGVACTLPGNCHSLKDLSYVLSAATDAIVEIPLSRWDTNEYYDPSMPTGREMYVQHAGFIEGVDLFDAEMFKIGRSEVMAMDPQQRHLLEVSFDAFVDSGFSKSELMSQFTGVFVGQDKCDWNRMLTVEHAGPFAATGGSSSISSNRISYALGFKGPSCTMDTACSSSLVAADTAAATLRRGRCQRAAVCGVNMCLLPQTFVACCQARMLSVDGRCHTFDKSASGYTRGEGCGAEILERFDEQRAWLVEYAGSALNQDGRSANLTSPNGPSQSAVVLAALSEAGVLPHMLNFLETHGTGTELGDPIEVGALQASVAGPPRQAPLITGAVKTSVGHLEGGAGMAGMLKLVSVLQWNSCPSNLHLRVLNSYIAENTMDAQQHFPCESALLKTHGRSAASVSSFGFGGTNGHVVLTIPGASAQGIAKLARPVVEHQRQQFPWREPGHPLIRKRSERADGATVYSGPIDGHVLELLSHHIVHGEVVVPGACYLEMILAGVTAHLGRKDAWCIEGLGFAKPLVLRLLDGALEEPVELRLVLWEDGRLEVESEVGSDPDDSSIATHVEATYVRKSGGWTENRPERDSFKFESLRSECPNDMDIDLMYSFGVRCGLPLQKRFRAVRQVQTGGQNGFARLEMERDGTHVGFWLGPSVIDSTFQALMSLGDEENGVGSLKIPLSIRKLQPTGRAFSIAVWSYFELTDWTEHSTVFKAWLMNDAGEVLLHFEGVHLQEVREEHIKKVLQASGREDPDQRAMYEVDWRPMESLAGTSSPAENLLVVKGPDDQPKVETIEDHWLVVGDPDAMTHFPSDNDRSYHCMTHGKDVDLLDEAGLDRLLKAETWTAVVFTAGLSAGGDVDTLNLALHLVRALVALGATAPPMWLLTSGAQLLATDDAEIVKEGSYTHAGLWGFARSVRAEYPDNLRLGCLDVDPTNDFKNLRKILVDALPTLVSAGENEVVIRGSNMHSNRLMRSSVAVQGAVRLNMPARGSLHGLRPVPQQVRQSVPPGFVQLRIRAIGLNFRDVLNVMGLYPGDPGPPGADCSGTVIQLGDQVNHLRLGDDVFGEAPGCLSTYSVAPAALLTQKPPTWSFEEASAMPVIFGTVEESLGDIAKLRRGERVLIHAAAGGVGLVAIQYAQYVGAEVYATAGAEEKHEFLRGLGVKYITSTRNGQKFEDDMRGFLAESGVDGVDVVLNSLSHDDYIPRSLALLKKHGRFMEIGKRGVWSHEQMRAERPDVMYEKIAADTMMEKEPWRYNGYLKRLLTRVEEGGLRPINMHVFEGLQNGVAALEFLQHAKNIGKVVIREPSRMMCRPGATTLLSGGTGALGQVVAQFLVEEGSKSLCLISRGGQAATGLGSWWKWLQASTATIGVEKCDVSSETSVLALRGKVSEPVGGLIHLAGVLADGMLPSLTKESFQTSYGAKVHGLHFLRNLIAQGRPLDEGEKTNFVLFSSTSSLFGSPGQANYSAANSVLDAIAPHWTALDNHCRARAIQWGAWGEVGMAVEKNTLPRLKASGLGALSNTQGMTILGSILQGARCTVGAAHVRWNKFLRAAYTEVPPFLQDLQAEAQRAAPVAAEGGGLDLTGLSPDDRRATILSAVHRLAREVVDSSDLAGDAPLLDSGMDSLSGVEFRNRLLMDFQGIRIPNSAVFDYPTVEALANYVNSQYDATSSTPDTTLAAASSSREGAAQIVEKLNERIVGSPVFLLPGAGLQSGAFRSLAALLPVPAYGISWPRGFRGRTEWPATLRELAELLLQEIQSVWPSGPYFLAGHSFGATLCVEIAQIAESRGLLVATVALLDPRNLPPMEADLSSAFSATGLVETLALLSQTAEDGSRYLAPVEQLMQLEAPERDDAIKKLLNPAAMASLEHVHETSQWFAGLLKTCTAQSGRLSAHVSLLTAAETWREEAPADMSAAENVVRTFQAQIFQESDDVLNRISQFSNPDAVSRSCVPAGHFAMLREPFVVNIALQLCHCLIEGSKAISKSGSM